MPTQQNDAYRNCEDSCEGDSDSIIKDIIAFLKRRCKAFFAIFIISLCLSLLFFLSKSETSHIGQKTLYEAKLHIMLMPNYPDYSPRSDPYAMMIDIIKSRPVIEKAYAKILKGKMFLISNPDDYGNAVQIPSTNTIVLSVKNVDQAVAEELVYALAEMSILEFQEQQNRLSQLAKRLVLSNINELNNALDLKAKSQALSEARLRQLWRVAYAQHFNQKLKGPAIDWSNNSDVMADMLAVLRAKASLSAFSSPPRMYAEIIEKTQTLKILPPENQGKRAGKKLIILSITISILMAVCGTLIIERFDRRIHSEKDLIKYTPVSLHATIPKLSSKEAHCIFSQEGEVTRGSEAIRKLRSFLMQCNIKTLMVVGSIPNEGTSTIATNLSISLALAGKKTLLIDADLRTPTVHKLLQIREKPGLTDFIISSSSSIDSAIIEVDWVSNLSVITSASLTFNPSIILESTKWKGLMDVLKERYDYIVFDTPPIENHPDALILKSSVNCIEGALLICASEETSKNVVKNSIKVMGIQKIPVVGIVLNKVL